MVVDWERTLAVEQYLCLSIYNPRKLSNAKMTPQINIRLRPCGRLQWPPLVNGDRAGRTNEAEVKPRAREA